MKEVQQGQALLAMHFIAQSALDIRHKIQKTIAGPRTLMNDLFQLAYSVFNNRDILKNAECTQRNMQKDTGATFLVLTQKIGNLSNHKEYVMGGVREKAGAHFPGTPFVQDQWPAVFIFLSVHA